jgi:hypothetical protein
VLVPWEDVFFYRHTRAASYIRGTCTATPPFPMSCASSTPPI